MNESRVQLVGPFNDGQRVVVDGKRVPMLAAYPEDGGKVLLVFDHRIGLHLDAANYERVTAFVADVMEQVMDPQCGRTFNTVRLIDGSLPSAEEQHEQHRDEDDPRDGAA